METWTLRLGEMDMDIDMEKWRHHTENEKWKPRRFSLIRYCFYNIPHPSLLVHMHDKESRNALLILVQEIKRDDSYRRMNLPPSVHQVTDPRRLAAHIDSVIRRLCSYLQYIGFVQFAKASATLQRLQELNLDWCVSDG
jgi:hypothetical protein